MSYSSTAVTHNIYHTRECHEIVHNAACDMHDGDKKLILLCTFDVLCRVIQNSEGTKKNPRLGC